MSNAIQKERNGKLVTVAPKVTRMREAVGRLTCGCIAKCGNEIVDSGTITYPLMFCLAHGEQHYGMKFESLTAHDKPAVWPVPNALAQGREHSERPAGAEG